MPVGSLVHLAPDCSSWGIPSRGTSLRNFVNVAGNVFLPWIQGANEMIAKYLSPFVQEVILTYKHPHRRLHVFFPPLT